MKALLLISLLMFSQKLSPSTLKIQVINRAEQAVLNQIQKNHPKLDQNFSKQLAQTIVKKSNKYGISPRVLAAMLMQESSYRISAKNIKCGISMTTGERDCVAVDFGIGQINHKTIKHFKFDETKLLTDLTYSVETSAIVLADFKRMYGSKEKEFWTRYNSSNKAKRNIYKTLVARYM